MQKWHLRYRTGDISEPSSLRPKLLQSVYRNSCTAYRLVTNLVTYCKLWPTFLGSNVFQTLQQTFRPLLSKLSKIRQIHVLYPHFEEVKGGVEPWLISGRPFPPENLPPSELPPLFVLYCRNCPKDDEFRYFIPILRKLGAELDTVCYLTVQTAPCYVPSF